MEPDGIYADEFHDLTRFEGTYRFHAIATYSTTCKGRREAQWAIQVGLGIDPDRSSVDFVDFGRGPDGPHAGQVVVIPRDRYGNGLGPGRGDEVNFGGGSGTTVTGVTDNGDGSYAIGVGWDPRMPRGPAVVIGQPDRPPVTVGPGLAPSGKPCPWWLRWLLLLLILLLLLAVVVIVWLAAS